MGFQREEEEEVVVVKGEVVLALVQKQINFVSLSLICRGLQTTTARRRS